MSRLPWVWASPPHGELSALSRDLEAGLLPADRELIKENRLRSVWRVPGVDGGLLLKHYRIREGEALKTRLLGGRAEREYRAMESFCRAGLPSARPIAFANNWQSGRLVEAWFLSRFVPAARPLADVLLSHAHDEQACFALAEQAVAVVAQMHKHPFLHRDLHSGNLLIDGDGQLVIIDLHSLWHVRKLSARQRWDTLARLVFSMRETVSLDDAPRLAALYASEWGELPSLAVRSLSSALDRFASDYRRGRSARCLRTSSEFVREQLNGQRVHRRRDYDPKQLIEDLQHHRQLVSDGGTLLGDAGAAQVSSSGVSKASRVIKHYRRRGPLLALRCWAGHSRARVAWVSARRCAVHGVPTPRALALVEESDGSSWLVTDELGNAPSLREIAADMQGSTTVDQRGPLAFALGHVVGRLSRAGLRHADLSSKNILIDPGPPPRTRDRRTCPGTDSVNVQLIDLDGMRVGKAHDGADLLRMLSQLADLPSWVTHTDRSRFAMGFRASSGKIIPEDLARQALHAGRQRGLRRQALESAARPSA
ncbi:MAG: tRNA A-37 threonylcarbamoyl transferase component Bud32 [Pseudohongiellaceae bacterium]|jgi:tRNA A-37 threonylcarbamoyl transferase component Bud32